jgi:hypothetical protein
MGQKGKPTTQKTENYSGSEELLRDSLIDKILIVSAVVVISSLASAQLRAFDIGWTYRDVLQFIDVGLLTVLVLVRHNITAHHKALLLIILFSLGGLPGVYTLGILAGTIFVFPLAAVIVATFYSARATLAYIILTLLFCCFVAFRFCSGMATLPFSADRLIFNYFHWFVYLVCMGAFFIVAAFTINNYRGTVSILMERIASQRDQLEKSNEELNNALKSVKKLSGLLPICSYCKKIRDDKGYWRQIESYIRDHSEADFSHGVCDECARKHYPGVRINDD